MKTPNSCAIVLTMVLSLVAIGGFGAVQAQTAFMGSESLGYTGTWTRYSNATRTTQIGSGTVFQTDLEVYLSTNSSVAGPPPGSNNTLLQTITYVTNAGTNGPTSGNYIGNIVGVYPGAAGASNQVKYKPSSNEWIATVTGSTSSSNSLFNPVTGPGNSNPLYGTLAGAVGEWSEFSFSATVISSDPGVENPTGVYTKDQTNVTSATGTFHGVFVNSGDSTAFVVDLTINNFNSARGFPGNKTSGGAAAAGFFGPLDGFSGNVATPEIAISGNSVEIASGDATPATADHTDFPSTAVAGGTVTRTFTIANTGTADLVLNGTPKVSISGANASDFTVTAQPTSPVAASGSTTFQITFDPSSVGARNATVTVANDDTDEGAYSFDIAGSGLDAPFVVTTTADTEATDSVTSLREAIIAANSNADASTITFAPTVTGTIQLDSALPGLSTNLTITGPGANLLTVRGEGAADPYRIFTIGDAQTVSISNLTITNGKATQGGGLYSHGTLTLTNCTVSGNTADDAGGGIFSEGISTSVTLNLNASTVSGNTAGAEGGGIMNTCVSGGNSASANLANSTISGNSAGTDYGGGLLNEGYTGGLGISNITNCTFSGNSAPLGGGIYNEANSGTATVNVGDTVFKEGASGENIANNLAPAVGATVNSQGHNLSDDATGGDAAVTPGGLLNGTGDVRNTAPKLGPLQNNGGPTATHALLAGSPAIDAGNTALTTDQRGAARPQGSGDDIGAYETRQGFAISGLVRTNSLAPIGGVSVTLTETQSGASAGSTTTNSSGAFNFPNLNEGYYTVAVSKTGFNFSPTTQILRVTNANRAANFVGTPTNPVFSLIGRISDSSGVAIPNVSVALSSVPGGVASPALTNSAGYYTFTNVPNGSYTVTPTKSGYFFTPASKNVTVNGANLSGQNFIGSTGYTVSGRIATSSGIGITGATVTIDGGATATTNSAGYYTFYNVADGSHTLVPTKAGTTFAPANRTVDVNGANLSGRNFTGTGP